MCLKQRSQMPSVYVAANRADFRYYVHVSLSVEAPLAVPVCTVHIQLYNLLNFSTVVLICPVAVCSVR